ncbi:hypothetical protein [Candidatus Sneabacter namystus]|uniref:Uncharacterized protein n=1 Tax=Candidatus Sneabacter namystus TaxID=2601646 RepID=A0A5C0UI67_9RICK|nr:hypothetical protein [Candidatus Sneabacter namystus]QEK39798.1 hypothetical protein FZC37_02585 [Candidatus Sneabacter namystus]
MPFDFSISFGDPFSTLGQGMLCNDSTEFSRSDFPAWQGAKVDFSPSVSGTFGGLCSTINPTSPLSLGLGAVKGNVSKVSYEMKDSRYGLDKSTTLFQSSGANSGSDALNKMGGTLKDMSSSPKFW